MSELKAFAQSAERLFELLNRNCCQIYISSGVQLEYFLGVIILPRSFEMDPQERSAQIKEIVSKLKRRRDRAQALVRKVPGVEEAFLARTKRLSISFITISQLLHALNE